MPRRAEDRKTKVSAKVRGSEHRPDAKVVDFATSEGSISVAVSSNGDSLVLHAYDAQGSVKFQMPDGSLLDVSAGKLQKRVKLPDAKAVARWGADLIPLDHEEIWALAIDNQNKLKAAHLIASGGIGTSQIDVRKVARLMLQEGAAAFILVHNHPSGDPTPSRDDVTTTARLHDVGLHLGVKLLDHVIVAREGHRSLLDEGLMPS